MASNTIADEIMQKYSDENYVEYCQNLCDRDAVNITNFDKTPLGKEFWVDLRRCFYRCKLNPNHVLEYFGVFSNLDANALREKTMTLVMADVPFWKHVGTVVTLMKFIKFEEWIAYMQKNDSICDELMLFILSRVHYRHVIVYTSNRAWSTIKTQKPLSIGEIHRMCDLHLIFLGNCTFGELRRLPMTPAPRGSSLPATPIYPKQPVNKILKKTGTKALDLSTKKPKNVQNKKRGNPVPCRNPRKKVNEVVVLDLEPDETPRTRPKHKLAKCFNKRDMRCMSYEVSELMKQMVRSDCLPDMSSENNSSRFNKSNDIPEVISCFNSSDNSDIEVVNDLECEEGPQQHNQIENDENVQNAEMCQYPYPINSIIVIQPEVNINEDIVDETRPAAITVTDNIDNAELGSSNSVASTSTTVDHSVLVVADAPEPLINSNKQYQSEDECSIVKSVDKSASKLAEVPEPLTTGNNTMTSTEEVLQTQPHSPVRPLPAEMPNVLTNQLEHTAIVSVPAVTDNHQSTETSTVTTSTGTCFNLSNSLEDLVLEYFRINYQGIDAYALSNVHIKNRTIVRSLKTLSRCVLEKYLTPIEIEKQIVKHNKNDVRNTVLDFDKMLRDLAIKSKLNIQLTRVSDAMIDSWTKQKPSWMDIDPYSSLEECTDSNTEPECSNETTKVETEARNLRTRKRSYHASRMRRNNSKNKYFRDMCLSPSDSDFNKRKKKATAKKLSSPSEDRLKAQDTIKTRKLLKQNGVHANEALVRSYPLFQPIKQKKRRKTDTESAQSVNEEVDLLPPEPSSQAETNDMNNEKPTIEGKVVVCKLKTRTVGIKRRSKSVTGRKYRCPKCSSVHLSVADLNSHYKANHPPVKCSKCGLHFNTPSTLSRHYYKHTKDTHACTHCDQRFPFESDLKLHLNTHRTVKSFHCEGKGCKKSYFSKGELTKHAETHKKIRWNCELCDYLNTDKRNLKAHMRVHSNLKPYMCQSCLELFRYDTQLRRHLPCDVPQSDMKTNGSSKRSSSPDY